MKKKMFFLCAFFVIFAGAQAQTENGSTTSTTKVKFDAAVLQDFIVSDVQPSLPLPVGKNIRKVTTVQSLHVNMEDIIYDLWNNTTTHAVVADSLYYMEGNTLTFSGNIEQKNYIISGINDGTYMSWYSSKDYTSYSFSGKLTSTGNAEVHTYILYVKNNKYYIVNNLKVNLDENNQYSSEFTLDFGGRLADGLPLAVAYIVQNTSPEVQITASDHSFIATSKSFVAEKWSPENDLPGLGIQDIVSNYDPENAYTVVCEDSITTLGLYYNYGTLYVTGINTTASELSLPTNITIDGAHLRLEYFGIHGYFDFENGGSYEYVSFDNYFDWSGATSLETLHLYPTHTVYGTFRESKVEDLYIEDNTEFHYNVNYDNVSLHIPYSLRRYDYSNYGFKRVFVGDEQPDYPVSNVSDWVIAGENEGDYFGIVSVDNIYRIAEVFTTRDSIMVPVGTPAQGGLYYIRGLGYDSYHYSGTLTKNAPNLKTIEVPASYNSMNVYWTSNVLGNLYMLGDTPDTYWSLPSSMNVYVTEPYYWNYVENSDWNSACIHPYGWDFEWMTVNVERKGEFAQTYIEMTDADWSQGVNVKITGELNATDLGNIKNLTNLRKLDLSNAQFAELPSDFMYQKTSLIEVILPDHLTSIASSAFYYCLNLQKVTGSGITSVGNSAFYNCSKLTDFDLSNVTIIENQAFRNCSLYNPASFSPMLRTLGSSAFRASAITEVEFSNSLTVLENYVFQGCTQLQNVTLPENLTSIGSYAFNGCTSLSEIIIPDAVTTIGSYAFYGCTSLSEINLPEGLIRIYDSAFNNCNKLTSITLPSTLQNIDYAAFNNCTSLTSVKSKAIVPPVASGEFTSGIDLNHCTLYIAPFTIDAYRAAAYWNEFYIMKPLDEPVKNIYINRMMSFDLLSQDNAVLQDNPNMTLDYSTNSSSYSKNTIGQLSATGDGTLSAGVFSINHKMYSRSISSNDKRTTLVNNAENMRADSVVTTVDFEKNRWHFVSFPYDIEMVDIVGLNNTDFVIRKYNSANRASGDGTTSNWENVPENGVLEAGKGYIIQVANNTTDSLGYTNPAVVRFPSRNTVTKNRLFSSKDMIIPLEEYPAEFAHNRSWNLVGNPYPCYFNMHSLSEDFMTPIVLWRGTSYQAYSPVDDDIILRPNEAFFVQRPIDSEEMIFAADGRMHIDEAYNASGTPSIRTAPALTRGNADRSVFNFNIEGCGSDDRTRIVMNENAAMDYEINCDVSKFFAETSVGAEIYVNAGIKYDICERPFNNGRAQLGVRLAQDGIYTITLSGRSIGGWSVILKDTKTGSTIDLAKETYNFEAKAGTDHNRFELTFRAPTETSNESIVIADGNGNVRVLNTAGMTIYEGDYEGFKANATQGVYIIVGNEKTYKTVIK